MVESSVSREGKLVTNASEVSSEITIPRLVYVLEHKKRENLPTNIPAYNDKEPWKTLTSFV